MDEYIKTFDEFPLWGKVLLALPFVDILWQVYRLFKSIKNNYTIGVVLSIVLILFAPFMWIVDLITIAVQGKILWFDDSKTDNKKDGE